jgi:hypothetical protein
MGTVMLLYDYNGPRHKWWFFLNEIMIISFLLSTLPF